MNEACFYVGDENLQRGNVEDKVSLNACHTSVHVSCTYVLKIIMPSEAFVLCLIH